MTYDQLQKTDKKKIERLKSALKETLQLLEEDGAKVLPHLCDSDENPGSRLRQAMVECHIYKM